MLRAENVSKGYGDATVLRGVSYDFPATGCVHVTGPSGSGKTTFLRILAGLEDPDGGTVTRDGGTTLRAVFQEDRLIAHYSAMANLMLACPKAQRAEAERLLKAVGLDPASEVSVGRYSGGMSRRVAIVRALLAKPDILLLDEPFTGLDGEVRERCARAVRETMANGLTVLVTHDVDEAELLACEAELPVQTK